MNFFQAIILGMVQGFTEYLPISSSAHLILIPWLLGWHGSVVTSLSFDLALHLGTIVAVIWYFAKDWIRLIRAGLASIIEKKIGNDTDRKLAWLLIIGCIPGGIMGLLSESKVDQLFHQPNVPITKTAILAMAIIMALLALALFIVERVAQHTREMSTISLKDTLIIGLTQALAVFPGISRSGSTITAGLALGLKRDTAARFSFLLGTPIIIGAGLKGFWDLFQQYHENGGFAEGELFMFLIGFIVSAIVGYFCIKMLLRYLQKHSTDIFVYYRWLLSALIAVVAIIRG
jgi:undecaprenyl-diphosphatase